MPSGSVRVETAVSTWSSVVVPVMVTPPPCGSLTAVMLTVTAPLADSVPPVPCPPPSLSA